MRFTRWHYRQHLRTFSQSLAKLWSPNGPQGCTRGWLMQARMFSLESKQKRKRGADGWKTWKISWMHQDSELDWVCWGVQSYQTELARAGELALCASTARPGGSLSGGCSPPMGSNGQRMVLSLHTTWKTGQTSPAPEQCLCLRSRHCCSWKRQRGYRRWRGSVHRLQWWTCSRRSICRWNHRKLGQRRRPGNFWWSRSWLWSEWWWKKVQAATSGGSHGIACSNFGQGWDMQTLWACTWTRCEKMLRVFGQPWWRRRPRVLARGSCNARSMSARRPTWRRRTGWKLGWSCGNGLALKLNCQAEISCCPCRMKRWMGLPGEWLPTRSACSRALFAALFIDGRDRREMLMERGAGRLWSEHSERATIRTWAAWARVPEDIKKQMGRWQPSADEGYERLVKSNVTKAQQHIAKEIRKSWGKADELGSGRALWDDEARWILRRGCGIAGGSPEILQRKDGASHEEV